MPIQVIFYFLFPHNLSQIYYGTDYFFISKLVFISFNYSDVYISNGTILFSFTFSTFSTNFFLAESGTFGSSWLSSSV